MQHKIHRDLAEFGQARIDDTGWFFGPEVAVQVYTQASVQN